MRGRFKIKFFEFKRSESNQKSVKNFSGLERMYQAWKSMIQSMFELTKAIYSVTICKVLTFFIKHSICIAMTVNEHTNRQSLKIKRCALRIAVPVASVVVLTLLFGFSISSINGVQVAAEETVAVYGDPLEVFNQLMEKQTKTQLMIQPTSALPTKTAEISKLKTNIDLEKSHDKPTSVYQEAVGLFVDGNFVGSVENDVDLKLMLGDLLKNNAPESYISIGFSEDIEIKTDIFPASSVMSVNKIREKLTGVSPKQMGYTVVENDTWESLAEKFGTTSNELKALNPDVPSPLESGSHLSVIVKKAMLNIFVLKGEAYEQDLKFETEILQDESKYNTYSQILTEGKNGRAAYEDNVIYINGKEAKRFHVSTKMLEEPVTQIVMEGTKIPPDGSVPGESSGTLIWPLPTVRTISSNFGSRWDTHHSGIDIANGKAHGETIVAADAGTVEFARSDNSGYGLYVIINHGNGRKTLYGHTSELLVESGEKVIKGQPIALVGNTGNSYGSHLHFEVIENGIKVDPLDYVQP